MPKPHPSGVRCPMCGGRIGARSAYRSGSWRIHSCDECGHGITLPPPGEDELKDLYDRASYYSDRGIAAPEALEGLRMRAASVRSRLGGRTLLDVGAGTGGFLAAAAQVGYEVAGTELSEAGVRTARERFGLELRSGPFAEGQFGADERFDVVTMLHVLEHLSDPVAALSLAGRLLDRGGRILIEVPNRRAFAARFPGRWARQVFDLPLHLHHFTPVSLERALVRAGLEPVAVTPSIPEPVDRGLALASRLVRRGLRRPRRPTVEGTIPGGDVHGSMAEEAGATPHAPSMGGRVSQWMRARMPGYKITAVARARA